MNFSKPLIQTPSALGVTTVRIQERGPVNILGSLGRAVPQEPLIAYLIPLPAFLPSHSTPLLLELPVLSF